MRSRKIFLAFVICLLGSLPFVVVAQRKSQVKLPNELVQRLIADINDNTNNFRLSGEDLNVLRKNLKFNLRDLNADGVPEFFLFIEHSDWCGAGANCSYWVYQKTENGYKLLVEDKVLQVKETLTNGYRDLSSETPMGFCERNVQRRIFTTLYKYNGRRYETQEPKYECRPFTVRGIEMLLRESAFDSKVYSTLSRTNTLVFDRRYCNAKVRLSLFPSMST